jgi:hypothetical protein
MYNVPAPGTLPAPGLGTPTALIGPSHPKHDLLYKNTIKNRGKYLWKFVAEYASHC